VGAILADFNESFVYIWTRKVTRMAKMPNVGPSMNLYQISGTENPAFTIQNISSFGFVAQLATYFIFLKIVLLQHHPKHTLSPEAHILLV
jgi:hypothetical protein